MRLALGRGPRFSGVFATRQFAIQALPPAERCGYDDADLADISFPQMCEMDLSDYPILLWLDRLHPWIRGLVDAGGHLGTKYIAFATLTDLAGLDWTVLDTPGIIAAARQRQAAGTVPAALRFVDQPGDVTHCDLLLASGLLQYLDVPFGDFIASLPDRPAYILLNKVALRDGPTLFTHERLGHKRVPYQMRNWSDWMAELAALDYRVVDRWQNPHLGHAIPTHPWVTASESWGFALVCRRTAQPDLQFPRA